MMKNLSPARLTLLGIAILAVVLIINLIFFPKTPQIESIPEPTSESFSPPKGEKINIQTENTQQQPVNNFYKDPLVVSNTGTAVIIETLEYQVLYDNEEKKFVVTIIPYRPQETRKTAEQALVDKLGLTKERVCALNVEVHDYSQSESEPIISPLSFCAK